MAKTRECCGALSLRRTGDDVHVSLHKGFKIRLAGIVPVFIEFTGASMSAIFGSMSSIYIWSEIFRSPSEAKYGGQWSAVFHVYVLVKIAQGD